MPVCNKCGEEKEQDQFPRDKKSKTGYSYQCKKCNCARSKAYAESHPEWNEAYQEKYRKDHAQELQEYGKAYAGVHKEKIQRYLQTYRKLNKEQLAEQATIYWQNNKDKIRTYKQQWQVENAERIRENKHDNYMKNRSSIIEKTTAYHKNKLKVDVTYRIMCNLRGRIPLVLRNIKKADHSMELIGCSPNELRAWLEAQFQEGMTWDNYGKSGMGLETWQVDHSRPLATFDLSDPEQQRIAFHYTNLQPLWWWDNARKSKKWVERLEA
jgi:hypothetical protein